MDKDILAKFSSEPNKYYKTKLFDDCGFERRQCNKCKKFFWTLDENRIFCPDDENFAYSFIGDPPTNKRLDYSKALEEIKKFFVKNNHTVINRYPVVCRWRDDLYFTVASIVDFQRIVDSKIVFEFPANPLIVPQICLRFNDVENVGITGKHFSSFCMIGQHSVFNDGGYWKDECIDLDYNLLTRNLGIRKNEIVFVEDMWEGGGSFGASLEYFVRGLEIGNAVFTEFQGDITNYNRLEHRIVDMGAGLERFAWLTMGTPTAYDCCFGSITNTIIQKTGVDIPIDVLNQYYIELSRNTSKFDDISICKKIVIGRNVVFQSVSEKIAQLESIYLILDHIRTLIFSITDGMIPSNVGGGYNLRIIFRRMILAISRLGIKLDLNELIETHIDYLKNIYPEVTYANENIKTIIEVESERCQESKNRIQKLAYQIKRDKIKIDIEKLIKLYESDGITPDYLKEMNVISDIPSNFYTKLSKIHKREKKTNDDSRSIYHGIQDTNLLYYKNDPKEFSAKVLKVFGRCVMLNQTAFYARGGGQEPDHGKIAGHTVIDVNKYDKIVMHELIHKSNIKVGDVVNCSIDVERRKNITKHHTSTHILNAACRSVLGDWVWQHSAFKEEKYGRLDVTHHSGLTETEIRKIETVANDIIQKNLIINIGEYERNIAEQMFSFKIYQGGTAPFKYVRIVDIDGFDIEACGGTHVKHTGEIGLIKITKAERIQDGVVRIEFVAGKQAIKYIQSQDQMITKVADILQTDKLKIRDSVKNKLNEVTISKKKLKCIISKTSTYVIDKIISSAKYFGSVKMYCIADENLDEEFHIEIGKSAVEVDQSLIYIGIILREYTKVIVFSGNKASKTKRADIIAKYIAKIFGGSAGGNEKFAQGGGRKKAVDIKEVILKTELSVSNNK